MRQKQKRSFLPFNGVALYTVRNHFTEEYKRASFYPETQDADR